jgi:hypothetical protein
MKTRLLGPRIERHAVWMLLLVLGACTGCGGITASKSVSPLDFLLPGLLKVSPPQQFFPDSTNTLVCLHYAPPIHQNMSELSLY